MTTHTPTMSPEAAQAVWNHLLPQIQTSRQVTRLLIQNVPADTFEWRPLPQGESLGEVLWYLTSVFHVFLEGVCEGRFAELPSAPEPANAASFLAWDDAHFGVTLQKLAQLSGEQLLKPVTFAGITLSGLDFVSSFLANVANHVGQVTTLMAMVHSTAITTTPPATAKGSADHELTDEELSTVAGGGVVTAVASGPTYNPNPNNILITAKYNTPSPIRQQTQAGLGSLLGDGGGGYGAVGAVGGIAMIAGIWGSGVATLMAGGAAGGYTAGAAVLMFLSRF